MLRTNAPGCVHAQRGLDLALLQGSIPASAHLVELFVLVRRALTPQAALGLTPASPVPF